MKIKVHTPPTEFSAKCHSCGFEIKNNQPGMTVTAAIEAFRRLGWAEDDSGQAVCPECHSEELAELSQRPSAIAYICSPYRAKTPLERQRNSEYAKALTRQALDAGFAPITPHLYITQVANDSIPEEREKGTAAGITLIKTCDIIIVGNQYGISEGMEAEINEAKKKGICVWYEKPYIKFSRAAGRSAKNQ